jgi:predicted Zn-dependent peptidase
MEYAENRAEMLVECYRKTGDANCLAAEAARYEAVTSDDVLRVAATYLVEERKQLLSIVPKDKGGQYPNSVKVRLP